MPITEFAMVAFTARPLRNEEPGVPQELLRQLKKHSPDAHFIECGGVPVLMAPTGKVARRFIKMLEASPDYAANFKAFAAKLKVSAKEMGKAWRARSLQ